MKYTGIEGFFYNARERYNMMLLKERGNEICTEDEAMARTRLCNVFREDDKVSKWFKDNIRNKLRNQEQVLRATVAFRWFNKIEIGELLLEHFIGYWDRPVIEKKIREKYPKGPWVTGAFIVYTPPGVDKLTGVLDYIDGFYDNLPNYVEALEMVKTLELARDVLVQCPGLGNFMAYQIVCDLRYTYFLEDATDVELWAQLGPGSARGLGWIFHEDPTKWSYTSKKDCEEVLPFMRKLLNMSIINTNWPSEWGEWEMSTVQHWLCEHDKICRVRANPEARMKRKYP